MIFFGVSRCHLGLLFLRRALLIVDDRRSSVNYGFIGVDPRIQVFQQDCFGGLQALLPLSNPSLILVDPPNELTHEYDQTLEAVSSFLRSSTDTATLMLWLPILQDPKAKEFELQILELVEARNNPYTFISLKVASKGLLGSSVLLVCPPEGMKGKLREAGEYLSSQLQQTGVERDFRYIDR